MTGTRRAFPAILAIGLLLVTAACGDDSSDDDSGDDTGSAPTSTTPTTHPSTEDDEEAAFEIIRALEAEADELLERLYGDPSVVEDPNDPNLERLEELHSEGYEGVDNVLDELEDLNDTDRAVGAASPGVFHETYVYGLESQDPDTILYGYCTVKDRVLLNSEGAQLAEDGVAIGEAEQQVGTAVGRRVDGVWRLDYNDDIVAQPIEAGTVQPGHCETMIDVNELPEDDQP